MFHKCYMAVKFGIKGGTKCKDYDILPLLIMQS